MAHLVPLRLIRPVAIGGRRLRIVEGSTKVGVVEAGARLGYFLGAVRGSARSAASLPAPNSPARDPHWTI